MTPPDLPNINNQPPGLLAPRAVKPRKAKITYERACSICNDVHEGVDNGETREELREAISVLAVELSVQWSDASSIATGVFVDAMNRLEEIKSARDKRLGITAPRAKRKGRK